MMPFVLIIVGMCITLATPYIYHSLPEEARGERRRLRYRQKPDRRLERGRGHEGSRDHFGVTQVVEGQTGRHERKDTQHDLSGKDQGQSLSVGQAPNFSEATHKRENKGWVAAAVWSTLAAAGSPAQRRRCLSPPCGEVRTLSPLISYVCMVQDIHSAAGLHVDYLQLCWPAGKLAMRYLGIFH